MPSFEHAHNIERSPEIPSEQMQTAERSAFRENFTGFSKKARALSSFFVLATAAGCATQEYNVTPQEKSHPITEAQAATFIETKPTPTKYSPEWYADDAPLQTGESFDIERSLNSEFKPVDEHYSIVVIGPEEKITLGNQENKRDVSRWQCEITDKKTGKKVSFLATSRKSAEAAGPLMIEPLPDWAKKMVDTEKALKASGLTAPDGDPSDTLHAEKRHFEGYGMVTDSVVTVDSKGRIVQLMEATIMYEGRKEPFKSVYATSVEEVKRRALERKRYE